MSDGSGQKASDLFVECLEEEGCEYIFGVPGEENLDFLDSLSRSKKIKLILTYLHELNPTIPHVSTNQSLLFIVGVLAVVTIASWLKVRRDPDAIAHAGRMTGHAEPEPDASTGPDGG